MKGEKTMLIMLALVIEIWAAMFVIWGFCHEDKFIALEQRIAERFRKAKK